LIDPIGLGLEHYNPIGEFEDHLAIKAGAAKDSSDKSASKNQATELKIDASGYIQGVEHSEFSSPKELGLILANSEACQRCIVKQLFRYALGRSESSADQPVVDELHRKFRDSDFRFRELLVALVTSDLFLQRESN
jgi:hypothetical protein